MEASEEEAPSKEVEQNHENAPQNLVDKHVMAGEVMHLAEWQGVEKGKMGVPSKEEKGVAKAKTGVNVNWEVELWLLEVSQLVGH